MTTLSFRSTRAIVHVCLTLAVAACGDDSTTEQADTGGSGATAGTDAATSMANTSAPTTNADAGMTGATSGADSESDAGPSESSDTAPPELDDFSFFVTSLAGMQELSGSEQGFGGNLTYDGQVGIAGADHICETLAEASMPGSSSKQWRAFLSTSKEDAIDRVGDGPWYDRNGRLVAENIDGLLTERPSGDPALAADLPNEWGVPNSSPDGKMLDNHDMMTASGVDGRLILENMGGGPGPGPGPGPGGDFSTCEDWTSAAPGQDPPAMGHSWPSMSGMSWMYVGRHGNGCEPFVWLEQTGADCNGGSGVGCGGGYGGIYCFALEP